MDALTQAVEAFVSKGATWISDVLALRAVELIAPNLERVFGGGTGDEAEHLLQGSYLAGMALSNARLGLAHGLAHPLGALYRQPHGLVCAVLLPHVLEFNRETIGRKYEQIGAALGGDALESVRRLLKTLNIRSPFQGQALREKRRIIKETLAGSGSTAANPRPVTEKDVETILAAVFA
jgi:alcohol dehydrogenase